MTNTYDIHTLCHLFQVKWGLDFENFPISLGVIVFSYTSQIFLPTLEGNLIDRSKFDWMLNWSHIAAAAFKSLFGYICFLTFQNDTQQVIYFRSFRSLRACGAQITLKQPIHSLN
jgi:amino acid permease